MTKLRFLLCLLSTTGACGDAADNEPLSPDAPDQVDAPAPGPGDVTLTLEDQSEASEPVETFVAFQDGTGAWAKLEGDGGVYRARTTTGLYGFLVVCAEGSGRGSTRIVYRTIEDGTAITERSCSGPSGLALPFTITGTLVRPADESIVVQTSSVRGNFRYDDPSRYLAGAVPGASDLLFSGTSDGEQWRYLRRELGVVASDRTVDVDMADAVAGELAPIALHGVATTETQFFTTSAIVGGVGIETAVGRYHLPDYGGRTVLAYRLPEALLKPEDKIALYARALQLGAAEAMDRVRESSDEASMNYTLPALPEVVPFAPPALDIDATTPWTFELPRAELGGDSRLFLVTESLTLFASATWVARMPSLSVQNPSGLPGWRANWNVEATDWLWIGYETTTDRQMTSSGLMGLPAGTSARSGSRALDDIARPLDGTARTRMIGMPRRPVYAGG